MLNSRGLVKRRGKSEKELKPIKNKNPTRSEKEMIIMIINSINLNMTKSKGDPLGIVQEIEIWSKSVREKETYKILWDFQIQTDQPNPSEKTRPGNSQQQQQQK